MRVTFLILVFLFQTNLSFCQGVLITNPDLKPIIENERKGVLILVSAFKDLISSLGYEHYSNKIPNESEYLTDIKIDFAVLDNGKKDIQRNIFNGTIAIAAGSSDDTRIHLIIDLLNYMKLSDVEKYATIFHELSHDIFNFKHTEQDVYSLMHPSSQPKTLQEITFMVNRMFDNAEYGLIDTFKPNEIYIHTSSILSKSKIRKKEVLNSIIYN